VRFLVDAQLPPALARALTEAGHRAEHVMDVGLLRSTDADVHAYARRVSATLITKDEDFATDLIRGRRDVAVIWVRIGNCSRQALVTRFMPLLPDAVTMIEAGEMLVEAR
jgi:predicted nuclease of predicted toxin-antitoxin system